MNAAQKSPIAELKKAGFLINPIAGMGGRVGLKGTDEVVKEALALGACPIARDRAAVMLEALYKQMTFEQFGIQWLTCDGEMGESLLARSGFIDIKIVYSPQIETGRSDTQKAVQAMCKLGAEIIVFCGGDGTARDVVAIVHQDFPVLGIPSGVKMYSGVFGSSPVRTAEVLAGYLGGRLALADAEILDLDESEYRQGKWRVRLCDSAKVPAEPVLIQTSKAMLTSADEAEMKQILALEVAEQICNDRNSMYLLGPGTTLQSLGEALGIDKTLLGIDAVRGKCLLGQDLNESEILLLLERNHQCKLVVSPIGAQGFVLGRGNLQLSPAIIQKIGIDNLVVIATASKLAHTDLLRFDTGDHALDEALCGSGYITVQMATGQRRLVRAIT